MGLQLNSNEIAEILPHRYPFALVDRITDGESGVWAKGIKCVSVGEPFFCGHFPQKHVMPESCSGRTGYPPDGPRWAPRPDRSPGPGSDSGWWRGGSRPAGSGR